MEWTQFKDLFLNKYFLLVKRYEKETEFVRLLQGNMTLAEYERKFDKLARYALHLVDTKECKARCFEKGLRLELYNAIAVLRLATYADVFQQVQLIVKDSTFEVPKVVGQSSFMQKKPWKGGNKQKKKFDGGKRGVENRNDSNKRAAEANKQLRYP